VTKIVEKSLRILFESKDLSLIKDYLQRQWKNIATGRISLKDFIFAKEVRLGTYSGNLPPAALVSTQMMMRDPRAEPRYGERVPYVVISGSPNSKLQDLVIAPANFLANNNKYYLNSTYYITKQIIPALARILNLVGVDVKGWYTEMTKVFRSIVPSSNLKKNTIDQFYYSKRCIICDQLANEGLCEDCRSNAQVSCFILTNKSKLVERELSHQEEICMQCTASRNSIECVSLDCPVMFERAKLQVLTEKYNFQNLF